MAHITSYPEAAHHPIEDGVSAALEHGPPQTDGEVGTLLTEQRELLVLGRRVLELIRAAADEALATRASLCARRCEYLELSAARLEKEAAGLFHLAVERPRLQPGRQSTRACGRYRIRSSARRSQPMTAAFAAGFQSAPRVSELQVGRTC